ncbi:hypothetical protein [Cohnella sp. AR92]|uniref:phage adaptor protein n=1 Tax=Cohnella sp. AR92 TaxID=648716 RepID=UPI000F8F7769|nr:hypothetical protein [Cohnella sp. AR92]RUS42272.1 hypothetical protein ELR57_27045 [Cohnella sp. AR92]
MKLSEIINEVNKDIDDDLDTADITSWVNRCLDDLTPFANYLKQATVSLVAGQSNYPKPADLIKIDQLVDTSQAVPYKLRELPLGDFISTGYKVIGSEIVIQPMPKQAKVLTLFYEGALPHLSTADDVPVIRADFHDLLVLYGVARARYQDEEESLQAGAMTEYMRRRQQFIYEMRKSPLIVIQDFMGIGW